MQAVDSFFDAPIAYGLDFGLTDDGRTLLIEFNDAYSLGYYGISKTAYAKMLVDRWFEILL